jgi:hypothetical protein
MPSRAQTRMNRSLTDYITKTLLIVSTNDPYTCAVVWVLTASSWWRISTANFGFTLRAVYCAVPKS